MVLVKISLIYSILAIFKIEITINTVITNKIAQLNSIRNRINFSKKRKKFITLIENIHKPNNELKMFFVWLLNI